MQLDLEARVLNQAEKIRRAVFRETSLFVVDQQYAHRRITLACRSARERRRCCW
jgi:hypothetical protein